MAKVVFKKLGDATARAVGGGSVSLREKRISGAEGSRVIVTISTDGDSFDKDLTYAFGRNVARARRENKRVTGALDRVPAKA